MKTFVKCLLLCPLAVLPLAAQPYSFNFGVPVVTSPTEAPGVWYPDRYPPHGFASPETAPDGTLNTLEESIAAADHQTYPANAFYNTQGRKYDLPPNILSVTIALYVPASWATFNGRLAGFWQTVFDTTNMVGDYPIIEFQGPTTSDAGGPGYYPNGGVAGFYGWNNNTNAFDFIGLPTGFVYNSWVQLTITLVPGTGFVYTVGDKTQTSPLSDPTDSYIGNTILEGYNYAADYNIFWDGTLPPVGEFQVGYIANLNAGDSHINISNDGASSNGTPASPGGNLCVGVFAFDPTEELLTCCSCLVTPDGLASLSAQAINLTSLTTENPSSVVIKLLAFQGTTAAACSGSLISSTSSPLASGLQAWGTTLHALPIGGYTVTENKLSVGVLSAAEFAHLSEACLFNQINGSGSFGQCKGCATGGQ